MDLEKLMTLTGSYKGDKWLYRGFWSCIGAICIGTLMATVAGQESIADTQDEEAITSRDWAARKVCQGQPFEWQGDVLICFKEKK